MAVSLITTKWRKLLAVTVLLELAYLTAASTTSFAYSLLLQQPSERTIYSWYTDRCDRFDTPDAPPRALRDFRGRVHLFATHEQNRSLVGPDFDHLHHSCSIAYQGHHADEPSEFDDRQWLTSFVTGDGQLIYALVHNEFWGHMRRLLCPSGTYVACWQNSITFAISTDGGFTFNAPTPPNNLIASLPYTYTPEVGRPIGYFQPTNIVRLGEYFYFMFYAADFGLQKRGMCVARARDVSDLHSWLAWDGQGYNVKFVNPYVHPSIDARSHVCEPVGRGHLFEVGSLTLDEKRHLFVMVSSITEGKGGRMAPGAYVSTSSDLIDWSDASPLLVSDSTPASTDAARFGFFSLIDQRSTSRDFSTISPVPELYLYYVMLSRKDAPYGRTLVKRGVTLER
jgi:hypothetical protein